MRGRFRGILSLNPRFEFKALKDWEYLGLNSLTLTLTPALSPGERGNSFPRLGKMLALDAPWFRGSMRERFRGILFPARPMNFRSEFKSLKDWEHLGLSSLTLTLTPALSPGEKENLFPRIGNMRALDLTRFRGSMREIVRGILSPRTAVSNSERKTGGIFGS